MDSLIHVLTKLVARLEDCDRIEIYPDPETGQVNIDIGEYIAYSGMTVEDAVNAMIDGEGSHG